MYTTSPNSTTYWEQSVIPEFKVDISHSNHHTSQDLSGEKERLMNLYPQDIDNSVKKNLEKLSSSGLVLVRVSMINKTLTRNNLRNKRPIWLMGYGSS